MVRVTTAGQIFTSFSSPPLMDAVPETARTCLFGETVVNTNGEGRPLFDVIRAKAAIGVLEQKRHFDGSNYAFMDGHVKWLPDAPVEAAFQMAKSGETGAGRYNGITINNASQFPIVFSWRLRAT